jgi:hypothetical protein
MQTPLANGASLIVFYLLTLQFALLTRAGANFAPPQELSGP